MNFWLKILGGYILYKLLTTDSKEKQQKQLSGLEGRPKDSIPDSFDDLLEYGFSIQGIHFSVSIYLEGETQHHVPHVNLYVNNRKITCFPADFITHINFNKLEHCCLKGKNLVDLNLNKKVLQQICKILNKFSDEIRNRYYQNYS